MSCKPQIMASVVLGVLAAALFSFAAPSEAGTCEPISAKGHGKDAASATTDAQIKLVQKAASRGGKVKNNTTNCNPIPGGFECKMSAALCP